jgi:vacuolar protein sorting-associated protein VTA1
MHSHAQHCPDCYLQGLEIPKPAKEISGLIKATFAQCEKDKPAVQPNEETDRVYCENFALTVFRRADKVDRAGRADINTCKAFYAAAIFLQVMRSWLVTLEVHTCCSEPAANEAHAPHDTHAAAVASAAHWHWPQPQ